MHNDSIRTALNHFHRTSVLVVGDVMLDRFVYGSIARISPEAPIPVFEIERSQDLLGGAANVARNVAALGARCVLVGVVGQDAAADALAVELANCPTIEAQLTVDPTRPTTVKIRYVAESQQVMRADSESRSVVSIDCEKRIVESVEASIPSVDVVILSDYAKGTLSNAIVTRIIELAQRSGRPVIVDPKARDFVKYRGATIITPNKSELQQTTETVLESNDAIEAAAELHIAAATCDFMVVTRGKDGMSIIGHGVKEHLPTAARQVFDVSGAGDTVIATLALAVGGHAALLDGCRLANLAAGIVVGKRGTATVSAGELMMALTPLVNRDDCEKLFALEGVTELMREWRLQGLQVAFANGCFDLLHPGHIALLEEARRNADRLIVGLNSDLSVKRLKGPHRPIQGEVVRATVLSALKWVDAVVIFAEDTPIRLIEALEPDVLVKGSDYTLDAVVGANIVTQRGGRVLLANLLPGHSTTDTAKRLKMQAAA